MNHSTSPAPSEFRTVELSRAVNPAASIAYEALYAEVAALVKRCAWRRQGPKSPDLDDITHEVLLRFLASRRRDELMNGDASARLAFIATIMRHYVWRAYHLLIREPTALNTGVDFDERDHSWTATPSELAGLASAIRSWLRSLTAGRRRVIADLFNAPTTDRAPTPEDTRPMTGTERGRRHRLLNRLLSRLRARRNNEERNNAN